METEIQIYWYGMWKKEKRWNFARQNNGMFVFELMQNGVSGEFIEYVLSTVKFTYRGWKRVLPTLMKTNISLKYIVDDLKDDETLLAFVMMYGGKEKVREYVETIGMPEKSCIIEEIASWPKHIDYMDVVNYMLMVEFLIKEFGFSFGEN